MVLAVLLPGFRFITFVGRSLLLRVSQGASICTAQFAADGHFYLGNVLHESAVTLNYV